MATAELKQYLTLDQFLKLAQQQQQQLNTTIMWSWPAVSGAGDDSMGTAWPPRSYTCAFCRREFRSAQALGGHMNVHRRDRARLRHTVQGVTSSELPTVASSTAAPAPPEFVVYPVLNSNAAGAVFIPTSTVSTLANGDVVVSSCMAPGHRHGCDNINGEKEEIDLELRLGWS